MQEIRKMIENKDIVSLAQSLCLPFKNGKGEKEELILNIFKSFNIEASYIKDIGIRVKSKKKATKVIVSHIDLIPLFNKGFKKQETIVVEKKDDSVIVKGALDNTLTNAVLILGLIHSNSEDVEFLFTEGEEIGLIGMSNYMKKFHNENVFYINLDVTNDNWNFHSSLEYDNPCYKIVSQLTKTDKCKIGFTSERECDDMDAILNNGGHGFSYCIPTKKGIHSYRNYTLQEKLEPYLNGLLFIIDNLNVKEKEKDIFIRDLHEVTKMTEEEFLEKNKKAKEKPVRSRKPLFNYDYLFEEDDEDVSSFNSSFWDDGISSYNEKEINNSSLIALLDVIEYELDIECSDGLFYFLVRILENEEQFGYEDLADEVDTLSQSYEIIGVLLTHDFVKEIDYGVFALNKSAFM